MTQKTLRKSLRMILTVAGIFNACAADYCAQSKSSPFIFFNAVNTSALPAEDAVLSIPLKELKLRNPGFNENAFAAFDGSAELPVQLEDADGDKSADNILVLASLKGGETRRISIQSDKIAVINKDFPKRTQAVLEIKKDYAVKEGVYTDGHFENTDCLDVPRSHFPHDALIKFEGPGWESDKVAYRLYLDERNLNDIFGKKTKDMVLHFVGDNDLVSNSTESYTRMSEWGMDIFKVAKSLGIGSVAAWKNGKAEPISNTEKTECCILSDGTIRSGIVTKYSGWQLAGLKTDVRSVLTIDAGSRLTKTELTLGNAPDTMVTGFIHHEDAGYFSRQPDKGWGYIASYGSFSLDQKGLGLAVFFDSADKIAVTGTPLNDMVLLKPRAGKLTYYFAAAWELEKNGIRNAEEFRMFLDQQTERLNNPVKIEFEN